MPDARVSMAIQLRARHQRVDAPPAPDLARARAELDALLEAGGEKSAFLPALRRWLGRMRAAIRARFEADNDAEAAVRDHCRLIDALVQGLLDHALTRVFRRANPTEGERMAVVAVGGYGRAELAPHSDVDLLFLHPYKRTAHSEQMIEFLLYSLWDLGLKVGQATRSVADCVRTARTDLAICTNLLEARFLWGDAGLFAEFEERFEREVIGARGTTFVEAKLAERDARHQRTGDSRYLLEPNVKEGKGGLRDLQTLFWLGRFLYRIERPEELVAHGVLDPWALRRFTKARQFLWAVRCHLHYLTDRPEERLAFDLQPEIAQRMGYRDRRSSSTRRAVHEALLPDRQGGRRADPHLLRCARGAAPAQAAPEPEPARLRAAPDRRHGDSGRPDRARRARSVRARPAGHAAPVPHGAGAGAGHPPPGPARGYP